MAKIIKKNSLSNLNLKIEDLDQKWKRAVADYQNLEKRVNAQQSNFVRLANAGLIDKLLSVVDDLERAMEHSQDKGIKLITNRFKDILRSEGVEEIKADGKSFDPETMDAADMVKGPKNKVVNVSLKGYTLNNQVIRPAKVEVGSGTGNRNPEPVEGSSK